MIDGDLAGAPARGTDVSPLALPGNRYPTGWFQVGWSDDVAAGDVVLLHYFGRDLVVWRGESGALHALDAYCLHLGGNLGVRGSVVGDDIRCPWHGWQWDGDGRNTLIPYSSQACKNNVQIERWPLREWYGCVLVWHDLLGRAPMWEPPPLPDLDGDAYYPITADLRVVHRIRAHPQLVIENGADLFHVSTVHGAGEPPEIRTFEFDGHRFHADVLAWYGAGKDATWLTPNGPVAVELEFNAWGIGLGAVRWLSGELIKSVQITNVTPIDDVHSDYFFCMTTERAEGDAGDAPTGLQRGMIDFQMKVIQQDFFTWENMKVLQQPNFAPEEAQNYAALRRWAWQFYPAR
jgi:phenylpropionate dioxygenase-like ring-hydroxylating dioxygenase large terminal subunit